MARGLIVETDLSAVAANAWTGTEITGDSTNGHYFIWGPRKILQIRNNTGGSVNVTFTPASQNISPMTGTPKVVAVADTDYFCKMFFLGKEYAQITDGDAVYVNVSVTSASLGLKVWNVGKG